MSFGEIFIILIFILLFFGSESIPSIARTLGRGLRQIRDASGEIQQEIRKSAEKIAEETDIKSLDLKNPVEEVKKNIRLDQDFDELEK